MSKIYEIFETVTDVFLYFIPHRKKERIKRGKLDHPTESRGKLFENSWGRK